MHQVFFDLFRHFSWYAAVVLALHACERRWPAGRGPGPGDLAFNFGLAHIAAAAATFLANAAPLASMAVDWLGARGLVLGGWRPQSGAEWLAGTVAYAFLWDLAQYWFHRLAHTVPRLWPMHALHHDTETLNATDALRNTLWHHVIGGLFIGVPLGIAGAANLLHVHAGYLLFSVYGFYNHANLRWSHGPLTAVLSGPQLHRLHHGLDRRYHNQNYAAFFPVIDIMFGTYRPPAKDEFPATGLQDRPQSRGGPLAVCSALLGLRWPASRRARAFSDQSGSEESPSSLFRRASLPINRSRLIGRCSRRASPDAAAGPLTAPGPPARATPAAG